MSIDDDKETQDSPTPLMPRLMRHVAEMMQGQREQAGWLADLQKRREKRGVVQLMCGRVKREGGEREREEPGCTLKGCWQGWERSRGCPSTKREEKRTSRWGEARRARLRSCRAHG